MFDGHVSTNFWSYSVAFVGLDIAVLEMLICRTVASDMGFAWYSVSMIVKLM